MLVRCCLSRGEGSVVHLHEVPNVRVAGVCNTSARDHVRWHHCSDAQLSALEDIIHVINKILDVLLRAQSGDMTRHQEVKVVACMLIPQTSEQFGLFKEKGKGQLELQLPISSVPSRLQCLCEWGWQ